MSLQGQIDRALAGLHASRKLSKSQKREQLRRGTREEMEHAKTIKKIKRNPKMPIKEAATRIAKDHLKDDPHYYSNLKAMEKAVKDLKPQHGLRPPRLKFLGRHGRVKVYLVDATAVRKMTNVNPAVPDFTMGSNGAVWPRPVGRDEIWISDELGPPRDPLELRLTWIHEALEMRRMQRDGLDYDAAHDESLAVEEKYRKVHGRGLMAAIRRLRGWKVRG